MKLLYGISLLMGGCIMLSMISFSKKEHYKDYHSVNKNSAGSSASLTGAPGEANCTQCHTGTAQDGNNGVNVLELESGESEFTPGEIHSMVLTLTDASERNGFQLVALNENNDMAGSFTITDDVNTQKRSGMSREYVLHTFNGNSLSSWSFDWSSPSNEGDVTFYVATNKTNSDGSNNGDVIYLSSHIYSSTGTNSIRSEELSSDNFEVGFSTKNKQLFIDFETLKEEHVSLNITDLNGKSLHFENLGKKSPGAFLEKIHLTDLETGIYNATLFIGNTPYSKKFMVSK